MGVHGDRHVDSIHIDQAVSSVRPLDHVWVYMGIDM